MLLQHCAEAVRVFILRIQFISGFGHPRS